MKTTNIEAKTSAEFREALAKARQGLAQVEHRLKEATGVLDQAQQQYDAELREHIIADAKMPKRDALDAAKAKHEALVALQAEERQQANKLMVGLNEAERREIIDATRAKMPELSAAFDAEYVRLDQAFEAVAKAELASYYLLFGTRTGLKQAFPAELQRDADLLRHGLRKRLLDLAAKHKFHLDPVFWGDDGMANLAMYDPSMPRRRIPDNTPR